jgi:hypothetical protein
MSIAGTKLIMDRGGGRDISGLCAGVAFAVSSKLY